MKKSGKDVPAFHAGRPQDEDIRFIDLRAVIGMIPFAVASGSSAELRNGIGWVIIGGMTLSTLLTLIVVPVVFKIFHGKIVTHR